MATSIIRCIKAMKYAFEETYSMDAKVVKMDIDTHQQLITETWNAVYMNLDHDIEEPTIFGMKIELCQTAEGHPFIGIKGGAMR